MESIYHLITDTKCIVSHYGVKLCEASPAKDSTILLRKGRHLLTFSSMDNPVDTYSVWFEVLENDIEDYIVIELKPIVEKRISDDIKTREKLMAQEQARLAEERRVKEERLKEQEKKQEEDEKKRTKAQMACLLEEALVFAKKYETEVICPILEKEKSINIELEERFWLECSNHMSAQRDSVHTVHCVVPNARGFVPKEIRETYDMIRSSRGKYSEGLRVVKGDNGKYGYIDYDGNQIIECMYDYAYPFSYGRAHVVNISYKERNVPVERDNITSIFDIATREDFFIDKSGNKVFSINNQHLRSVSPFMQGVCLCTYYRGRQGRFGTEHKGFDINGNQVFVIEDGDKRIRQDFVWWERTPVDNENGCFYVCNYIIYLYDQTFFDLQGNHHLKNGMSINRTRNPYTEKYLRMPSKRGILLKGNEVMDETGHVFLNEIDPGR